MARGILSIPRIVAIAAWAATLSSASPAATGAPARAADQPWKNVVESLGRDRDAARRRLGGVMDALRGRVAHDAPALLARLHMGPPLRHGYQVLPRVDPNARLDPVRLKRSVYSLAAWRGAAPRLIGDIAALERRVGADAAASPETLVTGFEGLRERIRRFEKNLAYHAYWQQAVIDYPDFFERQKEVAALARRLRSLDHDDARAAEAAALRARIVARVVRHTPTPGLAIRTAPDGRRVLSVTVVTDIDDDAFLARFREGVEEAFARSAAARARRFEIALTITRIPAAALYSERMPDRGAEIDLGAHVRRFADGALVLTTGAESTHAFTGRYVALGPSPLTRRVLAHEFAHLLGFNDAYVRSHEGAPGDADGVVVIEWSGLVDDLMGAPASGRVSGRMIDTLIEAYGARGEAR